MVFCLSSVTYVVTSACGYLKHSFVSSFIFYHWCITLCYLRNVPLDHVFKTKYHKPFLCRGKACVRKSGQVLGVHQDRTCDLKLINTYSVYSNTYNTYSFIMFPIILVFMKPKDKEYKFTPLP